jgi:hypothetical protein
LKNDAESSAAQVGILLAKVSNFKTFSFINVTSSHLFNISVAVLFNDFISVNTKLISF